MTTDNRANEPTEAQVEAAAKALRADEGFMAEVHSALEVSWSEYIARLVLVAAQGAAPQDPERIMLHHPERIMLHHPDGTPKSNDEIRSEAAAMREGAAPQAESDCWHEANCLCAPVLPSSGVDEDKLAEVIARSSHRATDSGTNPRIVCADPAEVARAVAAWLKGQGR